MAEEGLVMNVAMSFLNGLGPIRIGSILSKIEVSDFFNLSIKEIKPLIGLSENQFRAIERNRALELAHREIEACEKAKITPLFILDSNYPRRLRQCPDAPIVLYCKGENILNQRRTIAIVGSRLSTAYGKELVASFLQGLTATNAVIVSGLALGIDAHAHSFAMKNKLSTVAVLGSGLNQVFPKRNANLAEQILHERGALISEYSLFSKPVRENFPVRNRIIAGLSDATVVVESREQGGGLITADLANDYNRDVFAFPGAVHQQQSRGCNTLISKQKAHLISSASDFMYFMNWSTSLGKSIQMSLQFTLNPEEQAVLDLLDQHESLYVDELVVLTNEATSTLQIILLGLELKGLIQKIEGGKIRIN
ncbi:MAG: DNA-processing protein DprA [Flavobacteriales bacterium]